VQIPCEPPLLGDPAFPRLGKAGVLLAKFRISESGCQKRKEDR
jgi:hypothetical protein